MRQIKITLINKDTNLYGIHIKTEDGRELSDQAIGLAEVSDVLTKMEEELELIKQPKMDK